MTVARALLAARCAAIPAMLQAQLTDCESALARPLRADLRFAQSADPRLRFVVTGVGTSEGPARLLTYLLTEYAGAAARFVPLSVLAGATPVSAQPLAGPDAVLVVFSQGLSPNARLALAQAGRFAALIVYTSVPASDLRVRALLDGGAAVTVLSPVGPPGEDQLFLRVLGPAAAQLAAAQLADALAQRLGRGQRLPLLRAVQVAGTASERARAALATLGETLVARGELTPQAFADRGLGALFRARPDRALAFVTSGGYGELALGLRWKFLEGAGLREPAAWDLLQVVHGPLQQSYARPLLVCALLRGDDAVERALLDRLRAVLPPHHFVLPLAAELSGPLALLDHDLQCNELLLSVLPGCNWDLIDWPGRHRDRALYDLDDAGELLGGKRRAG